MPNGTLVVLIGLKRSVLNSRELLEGDCEEHAKARQNSLRQEQNY